MPNNWFNFFNLNQFFFIIFDLFLEIEVEDLIMPKINIKKPDSPKPKDDSAYLMESTCY